MATSHDGDRVPQPAPLGTCRFCGDDSCLADDLGPSTRAAPSIENPGRRCLACEASRKNRRRRQQARRR